MRIIAPLLALLSAACLSAEVIDRIAVSLDNRVVSEQEVLQQLRLSAFENREPLLINGIAKRRAAEQLVERSMIRHEMEVNRYTGPDDASVDAEMKKVQAGFPNDAAFRAALQQYGLTEAELRQFEREQLSVLRFIEVRFRPAIQVSKTELEDYYQNEFLPNWQQKNPNKPAPPAADVHDEMEEAISRVRETQALDRWMGETRRQMDIRWQQDVFK